MDKLRLLITEKCNKKCPKCVNKQHDLGKLPIETDFSKYNEVIITGGEPMLNPIKVVTLANHIRENSKAKIFMYTAKTDTPATLLRVLKFLDGITVTLHEYADIQPFLTFNKYLTPKANRELRLNIFRGVKVPNNVKLWAVKRNLKYLKKCPLPKNEVFKRASSQFAF